MRVLVRFIERLNTWAGVVTGLAVLLMTLAITWDVVGRYIFHSPTMWSFDLNVSLMVFVTYLGAAYTLLSDGHVRVDILYTRFSERGKQFLDLIACLAGLTYVAVLVWQGWLQAWGSLGTKSAGAMMWPLFPTQVLVPLGSALLGIQFLIRAGYAIRLLAQSGKPEKQNMPDSFLTER